MIIDVHTHLNNYHEDRVVSIDLCLDNLLSEMRENGVYHSLVLTSYKVTEHRPPTVDVVKATEKHDNISVVAGVSFLNYKQRDLREIAEFLEAGLIKGLKLYAPTGKVRFAHPLNIDDVAVDNPTMKIVICHIGNPWIRDCIEVVYKNPNVYTDVSGLTLGDFNEKFERFMRNQVKEMLTFAGEPKYMLYGTEWPICNMRSYLKFMKELKLPAASMEKIMWRNATELFKIDVPAS